MTDIVTQIGSLSRYIALLYGDCLLLQKLKENKHQGQQPKERDDQVRDGDAAAEATEHP
jgi:hypothetical protein